MHSSSTSFKKRHYYLNPFLFVSFFLLFLSGCGSDAQPDVASGVVGNTKPVQVLVWDDAKQVPLTRASVTLTIPNNVFPVKETDNSGRVVFDVREDLMKLTATFVIQKEDYQPQKHTVTLESAPVITVYLVPNNATAVPRITPTVGTVLLTPKPENTSTLSPTLTATSTNTPIPSTSTSTPTPQLTTNAVTLTRREGAETVFVLAGPDISNVSLGTLAVNETAEVIGRTEQNEWLQIITDRDVQGWVANCEVTLSSPNLSGIPITWSGVVTAKDCLSGGSSSDSGTDTGIGYTGSCVNISLSRTEWPTREFDDILLTWSNVPASAMHLKLWVTGPTIDGGSNFVIHPTFSDTDVSYKVEVFKFEDGDFKPGATYTYVVQPFSATNQIVCTTQGTFVP